jgi:hypothetical protein
MDDDDERGLDRCETSAAVRIDSRRNAYVAVGRIRRVERRADGAERGDELTRAGRDGARGARAVDRTDWRFDTDLDRTGLELRSNRREIHGAPAVREHRKQQEGDGAEPDRLHERLVIFSGQTRAINSREAGAAEDLRVDDGVELVE